MTHKESAQAMRPLAELQPIPLREWTADELAALRRARVLLRRTHSRTKSSQPPGYVVNDHDAIDLDLLDGEARERLRQELQPRRA